GTPLGTTNLVDLRISGRRNPFPTVAVLVVRRESAVDSRDHLDVTMPELSGHQLVGGPCTYGPDRRNAGRYACDDAEVERFEVGAVLPTCFGQPPPQASSERPSLPI